ncbi:uncharacterized protein EI97DRAFT_432818 [Westerdykella ornata]|uniref:Uncharacterized protein n=1 Tax=Westerdykella ornata TaxID=318751 RepID=A0A6A6JKP0_WESOR|nr:uncharacterized protein EI97DRAFT_432818 [Westerdykella ornata]KAF2277220.1 hypothetical protein EI97DRAFT_432818 [Westerdykella ornata]
MGRHASPTDRVPTFSAQTLPPGSAPKESTYQPNPEPNNQGMYQSAARTLTGADSADVNRGLGAPVQGQSSAELRHDGQAHRHQHHKGILGHGSSMNQGNINPQHPSFAGQRALEEDYPTGRSTGAGGAPAEDRFPEQAGYNVRR